MINSAEPFFSSRSSMRTSISVIATYATATCLLTKLGPDWLPQSKMSGGDWLQFGQRHFELSQVLALLVLVRDLALFVALEEQDLGDPLVGVDLGRERRRVGNLQRRRPLPLGLERGDVDDAPAAGVRGLTQADRQHVARNTEVLDGPCQS